MPTFRAKLTEASNNGQKSEWQYKNGTRFTASIEMLFKGYYSYGIYEGTPKIGGWYEVKSGDEGRSYVSIDDLKPCVCRECGVWTGSPETLCEKHWYLCEAKRGCTNRVGSYQKYCSKHLGVCKSCNFVICNLDVYCFSHKEVCSMSSCLQRVNSVGIYCVLHRNACQFEGCGVRTSQSKKFCERHGLEKQTEIYRGRWEEKKRQIVRIEGKLGGDLSDGRLQKLVDDERLLSQVRGERNDLVRERNNLRVDLNANQQQLTQTQSERDDYQNKWDNSQEELEQKEEIIRQLIDKSKVDHEEFKKALDKSKEWHERQKKDNLEFFLKIQTKQKELKELKKSAKGKLDINQKFLISTLLTSQEQVIRLEEVSSHLVSLNEKQLNKTKQNLKNKLSEREISNLCKLQTEITKLEMRLEQMKEELEAKVEIPTNN